MAGSLIVVSLAASALFVVLVILSPYTQPRDQRALAHAERIVDR